MQKDKRTHQFGIAQDLMGVAESCSPCVKVCCVLLSKLAKNKQVVSSMITFYSVAAAQGGAGGFRSFCVMFDFPPAPPNQT